MYSRDLCTTCSLYICPRTRGRNFRTLISQLNSIGLRERRVIHNQTTKLKGQLQVAKRLFRNQGDVLEICLLFCSPPPPQSNLCPCCQVSGWAEPMGGTCRRWEGVKRQRDGVFTPQSLPAVALRLCPSGMAALAGRQPCSPGQPQASLGSGDTFPPLLLPGWVGREALGASSNDNCSLNFALHSVRNPFLKFSSSELFGNKFCVLLCP